MLCISVLLINLKYLHFSAIGIAIQISSWFVVVEDIAFSVLKFSH